MKTPASPKVTAGGVWAGYATLLLGLLNTVTPDSLTFLGHLAPVGYGIVIGGSYAVGAYLKEDPLRTAGAIAQANGPGKATAPLLNSSTITVAPAKTFPADAVAAVTTPPAPDPLLVAAPVDAAPATVTAADPAQTLVPDPAQQAAPPTA